MDLQRDRPEFHMLNSTGQEPEMTTSRIRQLASQCCAMCVPKLLSLSFGLSLGFATVLIPVLHKKDSEITVSLEKLTWISSINFFINPFGALISGPLTKSLGRRWMLVMAAVMYLCGWLMLHWATDAWSLLLGFALLGFACGITDPSVQIYAAEISEVKLRSTMSTSLMFAFNLGIFLQVLFDRYVYWRGLALISALFSATALVGAYFIPESPHWLISKGRLAEAKKSLCWLRGWTDVTSVQSEYELHLQSSFSTSKINSSNPRVLLQKLYLRREFLLPFALVLFCFFLGSFNGTIAVMTFAVLVFEILESPTDEYTATLLLTIVQLVALGVMLLVLRRIGKRKSTLVSLLGTSFVMLAISVYVLLKDVKAIQKESSHSWIPMALIFLSMFVSCLGIRSTPFFYAGEMFSVEARGLAVGLLITLGNLFVALANKSFLYTLDSFTVSGTFFFFALLNLVGFLALYWTLPDTENKTFAEIEKHFAKKTSNGECDTQTLESNSNCRTRY